MSVFCVYVGDDVSETKKPGEHRRQKRRQDQMFLAQTLDMENDSRTRYSSDSICKSSIISYTLEKPTIKEARTPELQ